MIRLRLRVSPAVVIQLSASATREDVSQFSGDVVAASTTASTLRLQPVLDDPGGKTEKHA